MEVSGLFVVAATSAEAAGASKQSELSQQGARGGRECVPSATAPTTACSRSFSQQEGVETASLCMVQSDRQIICPTPAAPRGAMHTARVVIMSCLARRGRIL